MKGTYLGEFEELVLLTTGILYDDAYGLSIKDELEKQLVSIKKKYNTYQEFANEVSDISNLVEVSDQTIKKTIDE